MAVPAKILFATLTITIVIEAVLVAALLSRRERPFLVLVVVVMMHMFTHPLGAVAFYIFGLQLLLVEIIVTLLEATLYWKIFSISVTKALAVSIFANLASFLLGPLIRTAVF